MDQWLIRTSENWIAGPYSKDQVCQMILEGKLGLQDEVCPANGYWISVHEREEVKQFLGIEVPKSKSTAQDEEITQSGAGFEDDDITDPDVTQVLTRKSSSPRKKAPQSATQAESATVMSVTSKEPPKSQHTRKSAPYSAPKVEVKGVKEKTTFWRVLAWGMVVFSGLLVIALIKFLKV